MDEIKKTYILINSLGGGGAERQISYISQLDSVEKILCIEPLIKYDIPAEKIIFLTNTVAAGSVFKKAIQLFRVFIALKKLGVNRNTHLICFLQLSTIVGIISKILFKCKITLSIRINPFMHKEKTEAIALPLFLLHYLFRKADFIVPNSNDTAIDIKTNFPRIAHKVFAIENGYDITQIKQNAERIDAGYESLLLNHFCFLNIGRLSMQKGQWHIIRIMKNIIDIHPQCKLIILGEGELKETLIELTLSLGLKAFDIGKDNYSEDYHIYFLGFQQNPYYFYSRARLFLFPSIYEGLPNALIESMICGIPCISTDCKSGPREIMCSESALEQHLTLPLRTPVGYLMPPFSGQMNDESAGDHESEMQWVEKINSILADERQLDELKKGLPMIAERYDISTVQGSWDHFYPGSFNKGGVLFLKR